MATKNKQKRVPLSREERRNEHVGAKVNKAQKEYISARAKKCGLTVSNYILSIACGYEPKYRLTHEERTICNELVGIRADIKKFFANYNSLSELERVRLLKQYSFIIKWLEQLMSLWEKVDPILEELMKGNKTFDMHRNK